MRGFLFIALYTSQQDNFNYNVPDILCAPSICADLFVRITFSFGLLLSISIWNSQYFSFLVELFAYEDTHAYG